MLVVYSGVHTDIELDLPNGRLLIAERGVAFEVSDELGSSLCEQDTFEEAKEPKAPKAKTEAPAVAPAPAEPTAPADPPADAGEVKE